MQLAPREALQAGAARYNVPYGYEPAVPHWTEDVAVTFRPARASWDS